MAQDLSEKIDEYCLDNYGHTNWGYLDTYKRGILLESTMLKLFKFYGNGKFFW